MHGMIAALLIVSAAVRGGCMSKYGVRSSEYLAIAKAMPNGTPHALPHAAPGLSTPPISALITSIEQLNVLNADGLSIVRGLTSYTRRRSFLRSCLHPPLPCVMEAQAVTWWSEDVTGCEWARLACADADPRSRSVA